MFCPLPVSEVVRAGLRVLPVTLLAPLTQSSFIPNQTFDGGGSLSEIPGVQGGLGGLGDPKACSMRWHHLLIMV